MTTGVGRRALRSVGGEHNEVVQSHPNMCHHCGFHAVPVRLRCEQCGLQYHHGCGPPLSDHGLCDMCHGGGWDTFPKCYLCDREDDSLCEPTSTDRLAMRLVYHGLHWRRAESEEVPQDALVLPSTSWVALRLREDERRMFHLKELPHEGRFRMRVTVEGEGDLKAWLRSRREDELVMSVSGDASTSSVASS